MFLFAFGLWFSMLEDRFIYYPDKQLIDKPQNYSWPFEDVWLTTQDRVKLHAWWIGHSSLPITVLFLHGNAGNISHRLDRLASFGVLTVRFFMLEYRGYGQSQGKPSEQGLYEDAQTAYRYLIGKGVNVKNLILFGESLGGAVAIDLAAKEKIGKVVVESTFTSIREMAKNVMPFVPISLVSDGFNSVEKLKRVRSSILIVHGSNDTLVPIEMGRRLFQAANTPKLFYEVKGADHNDVYIIGGEAYRRKLFTFLTQGETETYGIP